MNIIEASRTGHIKEVKKLLEQGAFLKETDSHGKTSLMCASKSGHHEVVKLLLEHGVNANEINRLNGFTSLFYATAHGHFKVVKLLFKYGATMKINPWNKELIQKHHSVILLFRQYHRPVDDAERKIFANRKYRCCLGK